MLLFYFANLDLVALSEIGAGADLDLDFLDFLLTSSGNLNPLTTSTLAMLPTVSSPPALPNLPLPSPCNRLPLSSPRYCSSLPIPQKPSAN